MIISCCVGPGIKQVDKLSVQSEFVYTTGKQEVGHTMHSLKLLAVIGNCHCASQLLKFR